MRFLLAALLLLASVVKAASGPDLVTGTIDAAGEGVTLTVSMRDTVSVQVSQTWTATLTVLGTVDGTNYVTVPTFPTNGSAWQGTITSNGVYTCPAGAFKTFVVRATAYTGGSATVYVGAGNGSPQAFYSTDLFGSSAPAVSYATVTFTATGAAANGVTIVAAVAGKTIAVVGWSVSTDTAGRITLHHQGGAAVRSNTAANIFGGGLFNANGGERGSPRVFYPGLAAAQPVCADFSAAMTAIEVAVAYITY